MTSNSASSSLAVGLPTALLLATAVLVCGLLIAGGDGNLLIALAPFAGIAALYTVWRAPMRATLLGLFFLALAVDIPQERPADGLWKSFTYPIGTLLFENLNKVVGVEALRFSGLDLLLLLLVAIVVVRKLTDDPVDRLGNPPGVRWLTLALLLSLATLAGLELWGLARGGNFKNSLWQFRQMMWMPVLAGLFIYAFRGTRDFAALAKAVVVASCLKVGIGLYFKYAVALPQGLDPPYVTSHSDTLVFVTAMAICIANWLQRPSFGALAIMVTVVPWTMLGMIANNRRLAWVSLGGCLIVMYVLLRGRAKRSVNRMLLLLAPIFLAYLVIGRNHTGGVFGPAGKIMSVVTQDDRSSGTRDIENYNLLQTLKRQKLLGWGFGHEYLELVKADNISQYFALYLYVGHNSVLWFWGVGGLLGYTATWLFVTIAIFLLTRSYYFGRRPTERIAATVGMSIFVAFTVQAWGDMGMQSWCGVFLMAAATCVAAKLPIATGAYPAPSPPKPSGSSYAMGAAR